METQPVEKPGNPKVRDKIIKVASARGKGKIRGGTEKERIAK